MDKVLDCAKNKEVTDEELLQLLKSVVLKRHGKMNDSIDINLRYDHSFESIMCVNKNTTLLFKKMKKKIK